MNLVTIVAEILADLGEGKQITKRKEAQLRAAMRREMNLLDDVESFLALMDRDPYARKLSKRVADASYIK